jgi:hypothetical protein
LNLSMVPDTVAVFNASVRITIGDGACIAFWEDPWVDGLPVDAITPDQIKLVKPGIWCSRTVHQEIEGTTWLRDIAGELSVNACVQFLKLWSGISSTRRERGLIRSPGSRLPAAISPLDQLTAHSSTTGWRCRLLWRSVMLLHYSKSSFTVDLRCKTDVGMAGEHGLPTHVLCACALM